MEKTSSPWWKIAERVIGAILSIIGLAGISDDLERWQDWLSQKGPDATWWAILTIGLALLFRGAIFRMFVPTEHKRPLSVPEELRGALIANRTLRLVDAASSGMLSHKRFEDCIIVGPAMMLSIGLSQIIQCGLGPPGSLGGVLWVLPDPGKLIVGPETPNNRHRRLLNGFQGNAQ